MRRRGQVTDAPGSQFKGRRPGSVLEMKHVIRGQEILEDVLRVHNNKVKDSSQRRVQPARWTVTSVWICDILLG